MNNEPNFDVQAYTQTPAPQEPSPLVPEPKNTKTHTGLKRFFYVLLGLILLSTTAYGGYYYRDSVAEQPKKNQSSTSQTPEKSEATKTESFHFIAARATVFGTKQVVESKLALPNTVQALNIPSDNQKPGYLDIFSDKYNDEMANWHIGDPEQATDSQLGVIVLQRIDRAVWKALAPFEGLAQGEGAELLAARTPSAKDAALNTFAAQAKGCTGDQKKHFLISGFFDLCTTAYVAPPQADDVYTSALLVEGYGKKDGQEFILLGTIRLEGAQQATETAQKTLAKEYLQSKKLLKHSVEKAELYRDALQRTTITVTN